DSDKPRDHTYSIMEQADITEAVWRSQGIRRTALVVHDYGVSIGQELLARLAEGRLEVDVTVVVFLNGGLYPETPRAQPAPPMLLDPEQGPRMGALLPEARVGSGLSRSFSPSHHPS